MTNEDIGINAIHTDGEQVVRLESYVHRDQRNNTTQEQSTAPNQSNSTAGINDLWKNDAFFNQGYQQVSKPEYTMNAALQYSKVTR